MPARNGKESWEQIRTAFLTHFRHPNAQEYLKREMRSLKMGTGPDAARIYSDKFLSIMNRIGVRETSDKMTFQYQKDLDRALVMQVASALVTLGD